MLVFQDLTVDSVALILPLSFILDMGLRWELQIAQCCVCLHKCMFFELGHRTEKLLLNVMNYVICQILLGELFLIRM